LPTLFSIDASYIPKVHAAKMDVECDNRTTTHKTPEVPTGTLDLVDHLTAPVRECLPNAEITGPMASGPSGTYETPSTYDPSVHI